MAEVASEERAWLHAGVQMGGGGAACLLACRPRVGRWPLRFLHKGVGGGGQDLSGSFARRSRGGTPGRERHCKGAGREREKPFVCNDTGKEIVKFRPPPPPVFHCPYFNAWFSGLAARSLARSPRRHPQLGSWDCPWRSAALGLAFGRFLLLRSAHAPPLASPVPFRASPLIGCSLYLAAFVV